MEQSAQVSAGTRPEETEVSEIVWLQSVFKLYRFEGSQEQNHESRKRGRNAGRISGGVAQMGERLLCKQEASGSRPLISTKASLRGASLRMPNKRQREPKGRAAQAE